MKTGISKNLLQESISKKFDFKTLRSLTANLSADGGTGTKNCWQTIHVIDFTPQVPVPYHNVPKDIYIIFQITVAPRLTFNITLHQREIQFLGRAAHLVGELPEEGGEEGVGEGGELGGEEAAQYGSELDQLGPHRRAPGPASLKH